MNEKNGEISKKNVKKERELDYYRFINWERLHFYLGVKK